MVVWENAVAASKAVSWGMSFILGSSGLRALCKLVGLTRTILVTCEVGNGNRQSMGLHGIENKQRRGKMRDSI